MNNNARREFIKKASIIGSAPLWLPSFLSALQSCSDVYTTNNNKKLIVIQLAGGLDGLSAVIPYQNDIYYASRPKTAIKKANLIQLNDETGLHKELSALEGLYHNGDLAVIHNVGYPNPDRSHFRSSDIWHTGSASHQYWSSGWVGRLVDQLPDENSNIAAIEAGDILSRIMKGDNRNGFCISGSHKIIKSLPKNLFDKSILDHQFGNDPSVDFLYETAIESYQSIAYLHGKLRKRSITRPFQQTELASHLSLISDLISANISTQVYYASHSGFDTHAGQLNSLIWPLKVYNDAISSLVGELKKNGQWDSTLILTFSEFGRRVEENNSQGTDHGAANCVMLMGGALKQKGIVNPLGSLADLHQGDLKFEIDFRAMYATILEKWLGMPSEPILKGTFSQLNFV